jgi:chaperone required for assembly of F1-ATPase
VAVDQPANPELVVMQVLLAVVVEVEFELGATEEVQLSQVSLANLVHLVMDLQAANQLL